MRKQLLLGSAVKVIFTIKMCSRTLFRHNWQTNTKSSPKVHTGEQKGRERPKIASRPRISTDFLWSSDARSHCLTLPLIGRLSFMGMNRQVAWGPSVDDVYSSTTECSCPVYGH
ncbi:uncharacterized protein LOC143148703 isoform X2 [Ptiloglossa arizonensis]